MAEPISVLIVDDSAFIRKMVTQIVSADPRLCVAGQARDGADALRQLDLLQPDVITMDIEMPNMDGLAALEQIMQRRPTPTIMLSSLTQTGAEMTLRCLERGAVDFVGKPSGSISLDIDKVADELTAKITMAAGVRLGRIGKQSFSRADLGLRQPTKSCLETDTNRVRPALIVIGASTGGPRALQTLVPALSGDLTVPVVIIQHMPAGFTESLARRLDVVSALHVREAAEGDRLQPGVVLVAPGGKHLQFDGLGIARLSDEPAIHGVRPAVDVTLASLARLYGARMVAILLTGMGKDGARSLKTIRDMGGRTFAEDESTCVVYGMPKAAADLKAVECLLPLPQIAPAIQEIFRRSRVDCEVRRYDD